MPPLPVRIAPCMIPTFVRSARQIACAPFQTTRAVSCEPCREAGEQEASASTSGVLVLLLVWATERRRKKQQQHVQRVLTEWLEKLVPQADIQALPMNRWRREAGCSHLESLEQVEDVKGLRGKRVARGWSSARGLLPVAWEAASCGGSGLDQPLRSRIVFMC